jgi:hypothetical protein
MARFSLVDKDQAIHLAVEGSVGGTRFSQLFSHLSFVQSSRFHAMNLAGKMDVAISLIIQLMNSLPSVSMIILDDWCDSSGRISKHETAQMARLVEQKKDNATILLISKGSIDASDSSSQDLVARAANVMQESGFTIATLTREKDGPFRTLTIGDNISKIKLEETGFTRN